MVARVILPFGLSVSLSLLSCVPVRLSRFLCVGVWWGLPPLWSKFLLAVYSVFLCWWRVLGGGLGSSSRWSVCLVVLAFSCPYVSVSPPLSWWWWAFLVVGLCVFLLVVLLCLCWWWVATVVVW